MAVKLKQIFWSLVQFVGIAILAVGAVGFYQQRDIPREQAPPLSGMSLDGSLLDLHQAASKGPVLIYFWASWCGYCRLVSPAVSELSRDYAVVAVAMQSGSDKEVARYLEKQEWQFPTINDPDGVLSRSWGVRVTPTIVIVGSDGRVAWVTSGTTSKWGLQLRLSLTD